MRKRTLRVQEDLKTATRMLVLRMLGSQVRRYLRVCLRANSDSIHFSWSTRSLLFPSEQYYEKLLRCAFLETFPGCFASNDLVTGFRTLNLVDGHKKS